MSLVAHDRAAWLAERRKGIGSSDSPAILGVSKFSSPWEVWAEKVGIADESGEDLSDAIEAGRRLEPVVAQWYADRSKRAVEDPGDHAIQTHAEIPWMRSTVDRIIPRVDGRDGPGVLEIKTTSAFNAKEWDDGPPLAYQVQVQHQLAVTGLKWGAIAVLIGGQRLTYADVDRNDRFIGAMLGRLREFWDLVLTEKPPQPDGHAATARVLRHLYPESVAGSEIALPASFADAAARMDAMKKAKAQAEDGIRAIDNEIRAAMGEHEIGVLPDGSVFTLRTTHRKGYVVNDTTYRTLRFKEPKA